MQWVPRRLVLVVILRIYENTILCFVVYIFDLVHEMKAIHRLCYLLTASGLFLKI